MPGGDGVEALVHRWVLPSIGKLHNNLGHGGGDGGEAKGDGIDCCGRLKRGPIEYGWPCIGRGDRRGGGNSRPRRPCGALPSATKGLVQGLEDVGGSEAVEFSAVPDGLHPGIRPADLPERGRPGPKAQL